ncbi:MAG: methylenetetrahydrofolate reductase C-terminal domain-containing protein [Endomicrobia bacterium]|nr:methylenetetrahydrofolate reductase C-terminal domain-containing protein [Endomicrobiia bacterium]
MFLIKSKPEKEVLPIINNCKKILYIVCRGCNEVHIYVKDALNYFEILKNKFQTTLRILDYICNKEFLNKYISVLSKEINNSDAIAVFSCGVGVASISSALSEKKVFTLCNTFYLTGYKGFNIPYEGKFDCALCGNCYLNYTAGICPITSCSKSLLNGPCGGAKNGRCEVDKTKECGWEKITLKLKSLNKLDILIKQIFIHNHNTQP